MIDQVDHTVDTFRAKISNISAGNYQYIYALDLLKIR